MPPIAGLAPALVPAGLVPQGDGPQEPAQEDESEDLGEGSGECHQERGIQRCSVARSDSTVRLRAHPHTSRVRETVSGSVCLPASRE